MINEIKCIIISCDVCDKTFENYNGFSIFYDQHNVHPEDIGWYVEKGKHYCPECHKIDEDGFLILPVPAPVTVKSDE